MEQKMNIHPSQADLLIFFKYDHLPEHLAVVSKPFHDLAYEVVEILGNSTLYGAELTTCLRKLLEAKDCAVRAAL